MIETVRLSQQARDQLITLKRYTGIKNWNTLCRWAFCLSLREPTLPPAHPIVTDSSVEMTWRVFAGRHDDLYWSLLVERCRRDGLSLDPDTLAEQFKLHLHRGIGYLMGERQLRTIDSLLGTLTDD